MQVKNSGKIVRKKKKCVWGKSYTLKAFLQGKFSGYELL